MQRDFEQHITKNKLFSKDQKLLLAISGGVDSVVLAHLLNRSGYLFSLAHCNFQLRERDSDLDEAFCMKLAKTLSVPIFTKKFETLKYCVQHKCSIQLAARKLRYEWFHEMLDTQQFDLVLTAHHANDVVETMIINMVRGTGIAGLKGIPARNGRVARPLLAFTKSQIEFFAKQEKIKFRLDQSNLDDKYDRNYVRNHIVPALKKLNPSLEETFLRNSFHFNQEAGIVQEFLNGKAVEYSTQTHDTLFINKTRLKHERYIESIMHHLISGYGFNATQQRNIVQCVISNAEVGKVFFSPTHRLAIDRNDLVIKSRTAEKTELTVNSLQLLGKLAFFKVSSVKKFSLPSNRELIVNPGRLIFPMTIRARKKGDKFVPFGMKGFKLISDFLKDHKLNAFDKENTMLLVNGNGDILWVMGYRSDERYRVNTNDTSLLKISLLD